MSRHMRQAELHCYIRRSLVVAVAWLAGLLAVAAQPSIPPYWWNLQQNGGFAMGAASFTLVGGKQAPNTGYRTRESIFSWHLASLYISRLICLALVQMVPPPLHHQAQMCAIRF